MRISIANFLQMLTGKHCYCQQIESCIRPFHRTDDTDRHDFKRVSGLRNGVELLFTKICQRVLDCSFILSEMQRIAFSPITSVSV